LIAGREPEAIGKGMATMADPRTGSAIS